MLEGLERWGKKWIYLIVGVGFIANILNTFLIPMVFGRTTEVVCVMGALLFLFAIFWLFTTGTLKRVM